MLSTQQAHTRDSGVSGSTGLFLKFLLRFAKQRLSTSPDDLQNVCVFWQEQLLQAGPGTHSAPTNMLTVRQAWPSGAPAATYLHSTLIAKSDGSISAS